ncbi:interferon-induced protein 44-like [Triplophysa dalaica]|uniref:interferon-induced protein 44-like n=1 Tax=Triplophysa dalaica TaxID=1582913 RepID=UPI0024DFB7DE|nr:interferon-induced protein 44-like [Triplophysa dalaica]
MLNFQWLIILGFWLLDKLEQASPALSTLSLLSLKDGSPTALRSIHLLLVAVSLKISGGANLPFVLRDVMGLEPEKFNGCSTEDIVSAALGHIREKYKFDPKDPLNFGEEHFNTDPTLSEKALCLVYIIDASTVNFTDDKLIEKLTAIRLKLREKGIPQVIVMTKVDEACPLVKKDLKKVHYSAKIREKMQMCSDKVGVPMNSIFPVKNYHEEIDTNDTIDVLILKAIEQIVYNADDRLRDGAI